MFLVYFSVTLVVEMLLGVVVAWCCCSSQAFVALPATPQSQRKLVERKATVSSVADALSAKFAWTVAGGAAVGWVFPATTAKHVLAGPNSLPIALSVAMFCAGSGLNVAEVRAAVVSKPKALIGGVCAQFVVMPSLAKIASLSLRAEKEIAAGILLVGCCPGGAASNVVTLLAKGDVGLSIAMTATSTMCAGLATPALMGKLSSFSKSSAKLPTEMLYKPLVQTLIAPSLAGVAFNETTSALKADRAASVARTVSPAFSSILIAAIVCRVVANAKLAPKLSTALTLRLSTALLFLHTLGFAVGLIIARIILKLDERASRAISIEVGMQNSALAVVLATSLFPNAPKAALPGALSACFHSILGGMLASRWRRQSQNNNAS